jgi:ABC-type Na+ transport system ATPase subunit NatA
VNTPLLSCDRPRLAGSDLELGELVVEGPLLVLVGAWGALFQLLAGQRRLAGGALSIAGVAAEGAAASGHVGLMLADAPFPSTWSLSEVLCHSGGLLGQSRRTASARGHEHARALGLGQWLHKPLGRLSPAERRSVAVAAATLGEPAAVALEEPFAGLEPSACAELGLVLERALRGRAALVSVAELPGNVEQDAFVQASDELLFQGERGLCTRGRYAELAAADCSYRVVVLRHADALSARLAETGYAVRSRPAGSGLGLLVADVDKRGTRPLLEAAALVDAPIVELCPLRLRPPTSVPSPAQLSPPSSGGV